jgi:hypothetical protein
MNPSVDALFQYTYALLLLSGAASIFAFKRRKR